MAIKSHNSDRRHLPPRGQTLPHPSSQFQLGNHCPGHTLANICAIHRILPSVSQKSRNKEKSYAPGSAFLFLQSFLRIMHQRRTVLSSSLSDYESTTSCKQWLLSAMSFELQHHRVIWSTFYATCQVLTGGGRAE